MVEALKPTLAPLARPDVVQMMLPSDPTAGVMQVQPGGGAAIDWNTELAGMGLVKVTWSAKFGPLFVTVCV